MDLKELAKPFPAKNIKWRVGSRAKSAATLLAYVDARIVQDRFDEVCGSDRWRVEYSAGPDGGIKCTISVDCGADGGLGRCWIDKADGAPKTQIEGVKGGYSDAFKRAAVCWGVFRYGYRLTADWHNFVPKGPNTIFVPKNKKFDNSGFVVIPKLPAWALPKTVIDLKAEGDKHVGGGQTYGQWLKTFATKEELKTRWASLDEKSKTDGMKALFKARGAELDA